MILISFNGLYITLNNIISFYKAISFFLICKDYISNLKENEK